MYSFDYQRPADRQGAIAALQGDARFLAGGQSLVQAMRLRMSQSERLVDLGGIADLKGIRVDGGSVVVGAMTTLPPSTRMPFSAPMPPRSTSRSDCESRSRIACTRLWPPARKRASPCRAAVAALASAGRW